MKKQAEQIGINDTRIS